MTVLHTEQGYNLMKQWNLPEEYCVIARDHHKKDFDSKNLLLLMVRLSDMACLKLGIGLRKEPSLVLSASEEAVSYSIFRKLILPNWRFTLKTPKFWLADTMLITYRNYFTYPYHPAMLQSLILGFPENPHRYQ